LRHGDLNAALHKKVAGRPTKEPRRWVKDYSHQHEIAAVPPVNAVRQFRLRAARDVRGLRL